jgi:hypothetical protein
VNVAEGLPVESVTVVGLKLPAMVECGVMTAPALVPPLGVRVTVKLVEAVLTVPLEGPVRL